MSEMKNSAISSSTLSSMASTTESRNQSSSFHRSMSAAANVVPGGGMNAGGGLKLQQLKRNETSPSIMEMPSTGEIDIDDVNDSSPIVTSPLSELTEVDLNFNNLDPDASAVALTSPNLVSCMNSGGLTLSNASPLAKMSNLTQTNSNSYSQETRKSSSSKTTKIVTDKFSSESATASAAQSKRVQAGDISFEENTASSATRGRLEKDGIIAEKESGLKHASRTSRVSDVVQSESATAAMTGNRLHVGAFSAENVSTATSTSRSLLDSASGKFTSESHASEATSKKMSVTSGGFTHTSKLMSANEYTSMVSTKMSKEEVSKYLTNFDDLDRLGNTTNIKDVEKALVKYCGVVSNTVEQLKNEKSEDSLAKWFMQINNMMTKASEVPKFGDRMGSTLCEIMRNNGGMDIVMDKLVANNPALQYNSASLVHKVLETDNRGYVVEKGLDRAVEVAKKYTRPEVRDVKQTRLGTGIIENLFKHNEITCENVIAKGGLDTVVNECQSQDVETLRHCASALANAAMFGGAENQGLMIQRKVPTWLFPLAFHNDPSIKYYACLAIAVLVANKENEAAVKKSGILDLVDSFISNENPADFAELAATKTSGQSANWLKRLIPVLHSQREEARNLAAFHFCMEAELKAKHGMTEIFEEIGAVDALKKLASSPNGIASKYAAKALRTVGVEVPHKLSQQVPNWSVEDVMEWVKQIGFPQFSEAFMESRVDGDLLLQLTEEMLREDIQMRNGILRRRFLRELSNLRKRTDYSSIDPTGNFNIRIITSIKSRNI